MSLTIEINDKQFSGIIDTIQANSRVILNAIGQDIVDVSLQAFEDQGLFGKTNTWPERAVPNRVGIFADANAGRIPPSRRLVPRPALINNRDLFRSITHRVVSKEKVIAGTNKPYAKIHQEGGRVTIRKTNANFDFFIEKFLLRENKSLSDEERSKIQNLKNVKQLEVDIPQRKFLAYTRARAIEVFFEEVKAIL